MILLLAVFSTTRADLGTSYCVKGTITTKEGKVYTGYFFHGADLFSIEKHDDSLSYYALGNVGKIKGKYVSKTGTFLINVKNKKFFSDFLSSLYESVTLHQDVVYLAFPEEGQVPAYRGWQRVIPKDKIAHVVVSSITETSVLYHVRTPITFADSFITKPVTVRQYLGQPDCSYYAFQFSKPNAETDAVIKSLYALVSGKASNLEEAEYRKYEAALTRKLIELKKYQVVIVFTCSC